jgi:hypothetical protein
MAMPSVRPDEIWPRRRPDRTNAILGIALISISIISYGCGGATVPCPTPLVELDRHRAESEEAEQMAFEAEDDVRAAETARAHAARRLAAARASVDSARAITAPSGKPAR